VADRQSHPDLSFLPPDWDHPRYLVASDSGIADCSPGWDTVVGLGIAGCSQFGWRTVVGLGIVAGSSSSAVDSASFALDPTSSALASSVVAPCPFRLPYDRLP
jgi:hypothetical protein